MTSARRQVLPYLRHVPVDPPEASCSCPPDSWAPCGGQYEGRFDAACPQHRGPRDVSEFHYVSGCVACPHGVLPAHALEGFLR